MFLIVVGCSAPEEKAQKVVEIYFEEIYVAAPTTIDEELAVFYGSSSDIKEQYKNLEEYIDEKFENTYTNKFEKQLIGERHILNAAIVARNQNANTSLSDIRLKRINDKEDDFYFDFEGNVKIDYVEEKEDDYAYIHGQISVTREDDRYKINGIRYYSDDFTKLYY
jgi:hypothetical protein